MPVYTPPVITPPETVFVDFDNPFSFDTVPGATGYRLRRSGLDEGPWEEGAETDERDVVIESSPQYSVIQSSIRKSGSFAYHFAHPDIDPGPSFSAG